MSIVHAAVGRDVASASSSSAGGRRLLLSRSPTLSRGSVRLDEPAQSPRTLVAEVASPSGPPGPSAASWSRRCAEALTLASSWSRS